MDLMNRCAICGLEFNDGKALYKHVGRFMPYGGQNCLQKLGYRDINLYKAQREKIRRQTKPPTEVIHSLLSRCHVSLFAIITTVFIVVARSVRHGLLNIFF